MTTEFYPIMEQVRHGQKIPCRENLAKVGNAQQWS